MSRPTKDPAPGSAHGPDHPVEVTSRHAACTIAHRSAFAAPELTSAVQWETAVEQLVLSLQRRSVVVDLETLSEAIGETLQEASDLSSEPLSEGERAFLLEHTELEDDDLTEQARTATRARVLRSRAASNVMAAESSLSTADVAELTGRRDTGVRHSARKGDYFTLNPGDSKGLRFPAWQFVAGEAVPGLATVIDALPTGMHPLTIEAFMTNERESLGGLTPVQWLSTGGAIREIVQLADEKGRE